MCAPPWSSFQNHLEKEDAHCSQAVAGTYEKPHKPHGRCAKSTLKKKLMLVENNGLKKTCCKK